MPNALRNLLIGFRLIRRSPGLALTAAATLGLGIAATTALVSVVYAVLVNPLPLPESTRLVQVWRSELPALTYGSASYARYLDWREAQQAFTDIGAWAPRGMTLAGDEGPERVSGATASSSFFTVIGAAPVAGRWFTEADDRRGAARVVVIGEGLWRRRYAASHAVLGRDIRVDGELYTVVGVAPAAFAEVWRYDVWMPLGLVADPSNRGSNFLLTLGRLRPGTTLDAARRQLSDLAARMTRDHAEDAYTFTARDLHDVITEGATRGLWVLMGASALLMLIACSNVANLLLARAVAGERDLAVRVSLGASRGQLVSLVLGETLALGLAGSLAGAALAWVLLRAFVGMAPANFPRLGAIVLDLRVLAVAIVVAVVAALVSALAPAWHLLRADPNVGLRAGGGRGATAGRARSTGRALVVAEMALSLTLLVAAGLMVKSLLRLQQVDLGVTRAPVLTFGVGLPPSVADGSEAVARFQHEFLRRVRAIPGVTRASAINMLPIAAIGFNGTVRRPDQMGDREGVPVTEMRSVMDGYLDAMDIDLLAGRAIDARDAADAAPVAVVNQTLAARLWPGRAPTDVVGLSVRAPWDSNGTLRTVVGVMGDIRSRRPDAPPDPEIHAPFAQVPQPSMSYVVRGEADPSQLTGAIRAELAAMTPHVAMAAVRRFDDVIATATRTTGLLSWLSVLFGVLAGALAAVGVYGLMAYTVAGRERELAVRAAVGATRQALLALVIREGLALGTIGLALGLTVAWASSRVLARLLFEVSATDLAVFAAAGAALAGIALAGSTVPALRASRVQPVTALKAE
jgi:predicted permease